MGGLVDAPPAPNVVMPAETQPPTGMVTGRVIAEDTQHPARFANVMLFPVQPPGSDDGEARRARQPWINARTGPDGTFSATGRPGDYYAEASALGYMGSRGVAQEEIAAGESVEQVMARLPVVHIVTDSISQVNLSIVRGATVGGQVVWEDDTPASGVTVMLMAVTPAKLPEAIERIPDLGMQRAAVTDDRGRFRLTGVTAGEYYVEAMLSTRYPATQFSTVMTNASFTLYAPGVMRRADAKAVKLTHGEERGDVRIVLDLGKLHTVSGHVSGLPAATGGEATEGSISLHDAQEQTLWRQGTVLADGTFKLPYVPAGTYAVNVTMTHRAEGGVTTAGGRPGRGGGMRSTALQQTVTVGDTDVSGLELTVPAAQ